MIEPNKVPQFWSRLFEWFCNDKLIEELAGDLEESFVRNAKSKGLKSAKRIYRKEVIKMIRRSVMQKDASRKSTNILALLVSYVTIASRGIARHKLFSFINVFSLSMAMSTGLLVIGMITDLLKFDEFHENKNEVYRVISTPVYSGNATDETATSPLLMGPELQSQFPGIQVLQLGRSLAGEAQVKGNKMFVKGIYSDEHFFDFLSFDLKLGNQATALKEPFSIVLSESFAQKSFPEEDPMGKMLTINGIGDFMVTGVAADPPKFSHIQFEIIGSMSTRNSLENQGRFSPQHSSWGNFNTYYNYVYLPGNVAKPRLKSWLEQTAPSFYKRPEEVAASFDLQQINTIVPGKDLSDQIGPKMINLPIIIMSAIAVAILLSAIFNYTNLSMARALRRTREVGMRKISGASNGAVYLQFTAESMLLAIFSLFMGLVFFLFLRPGFLEIIPRAREVLMLELSPELIGWFFCFAVATGLVAGLAPSWFFMRISSLKALRIGGSLKTLSKINLRKGLIVAQFSLSIIFILALILTYKQYSFSLNKDMGFNSENVLNISLKGNNPEILATELTKLTDVEDVSFSSIVPGTGGRQNLLLVDERIQDSVWVSTMSVSKEYISNVNIDLVSGRNFRIGENTTREQNILVNEAFVEGFGLETALDALGKVFIVEGNEVEIIGVVKDFHFQNLENKISSFVFRNNAEYQFANVKIATTDIVSALASIENAWDKVDPNQKMDAQFFDDQIEGYYYFLKDVMKMFGFIGFLAISISCLGLFGIAIYSTETRMREIGVRKSFGASEKGLVVLLSKGFLKLVALAILIGTPICYVIFDKLILAEHFYRPEIGLVEILLSTVILIVLCLLTIVSQTWAAARTSPAKVLRDNS